MQPEYSSLFDLALEACEHSYAPYSKFRVGAALLCEDGSVITGVNVENRSYGLTICAERNAIAAAITAGKKKFKALVIATPDADYPVSPCGACRQVISEFMPPSAPVVFGNSQNSYMTSSVGELLPHDALHELSGELGD
ncbi:MAG: cytidine deaminase [Spirochaetia bacterium]|jgi:cytidine deaminase|uniref:Cytidine deaminase n=1 Tax=uncultured spirochete TaxID=156406 RepID=A0A3P3XM06_9SPIR|nr:cytidine deaminase [Rectinema subterraneum]MDQ7796503.1 cytidine deaminase [Spirochaetia bacterium]SLM15933.1 Cytidine deaminase [uncultured spirochete]